MGRRRRGKAIAASVVVAGLLVGGSVYAAAEFTGHRVWRDFLAADTGSQEASGATVDVPTTTPTRSPQVPATTERPTAGDEPAPNAGTGAQAEPVTQHEQRSDAHSQAGQAGEAHTQTGDAHTHQVSKMPPRANAPTHAPPVTYVPILEVGDSGAKVRELQARLRQIWWYDGAISGTYGDATADAVTGFQGKRGFSATGIVDQRTWDRLVEMTREPTHAEMYNQLQPGTTILGPGDDGEKVRALQARLGQIGWFDAEVTGQYGDLTEQAVSGFQHKRGFPSTGEVDQRTQDRLQRMTREPTKEEMFPQGRTEDEAAEHKSEQGAGEQQDSDGQGSEGEGGDAQGSEEQGSDEQRYAIPVDSRCRTGRVLCIDKTSRTLRWMIDGDVLATVDVRFGAASTPTREGLFDVYWKDVDHVSHMFGSAMPLSMFFSGGQAVHYSSDFAARGYAGASHGCVNVRDYDTLQRIFNAVNVGDKVVVYRS